MTDLDSDFIERADDYLADARCADCDCRLTGRERTRCRACRLEWDREEDGES